MLVPATAEAAIREHVRILATEQRALGDLPGLVLRERIIAVRDQPPFDRVTMDGIALHSAAVAQGIRHFRVEGTQGAGAPPSSLGRPDTCIEVMTGAVLPDGCDAVIPVERIHLADGSARLNDDVQVTPWLNVHRRGLDSHADDELLPPGVRIGPTEIALIATAGYAQVSVTRSPRLCVISTGDELIEPGQPVASWQIYRSNAYAVVAALRGRGYREVTHDHLPDDKAILRTRLQTLLEANDFLILSGGVSMGRFDYVPEVLSELGVRVIFHKVAQRPGKPLWVGTTGEGKMVFALPGNPVSTIVCLARYVYAALAQAEGSVLAQPAFAALAADHDVTPTVAVFLPVRRVIDDRGQLWVEPRPTQGSGDFISLRGTDGFIETPPGPRLLKRGTLVPLYSW